MIKVCEECGGRGSYDFTDYDDDGFVEGTYEFTCDMCQGEGFWQPKTLKLFVKIYPKDSSPKTLLFEIEETVNRPNNPEWHEIIEAYLSHHYGSDVVETYYLEDVQEVVEIDEDWDIEGHR